MSDYEAVVTEVRSLWPELSLQERVYVMLTLLAI